MTAPAAGEGSPAVATYRKTAVAVGLLFLTATAAFLSADALIAGVLKRPDYLVSAAAEANALTTGALLAFATGLAVVAIALLLFPLFKRYSEPLALGYVGLRVGELAAVLLLLATPLLVAPLSQGVRDSGLDASASGILGAVLSAQYDVAMLTVFLCTAAAGTVLGYVLYRSRLVPRPIATLGLVGYPAMLAGTVLELFGQLDLQQGVGLALVVPVGLFELVLPIRLIARGFDAGSLTEATGSPSQPTNAPPSV